MVSWLYLWKKEFALTRTIFYWCLALIFIVLIFGLVLNGGNFFTIDADNPAQALGGIALGILSTGIFAHFTYLPIYMIVNLELERRQMHLWLYQPQPVAKMLGAKYASGLLCAAISLFVNGVLLLAASWLTPGITVFLNLGGEGLNVFQWLLLCLLAAIFVLLVSLYFSVYLLFIYAFDFAFRYKLGRGLQTAMVLGIIVLLSVLANTGLSDVYHTITGWGQFSLTGIVTADFMTINLYTGVLLFHAAVGLILFFLSAQLIDKKAEV